MIPDPVEALCGMLASDELAAPKLHCASTIADTTIATSSVGSSESSFDIVQSVLLELQHIRSYVSSVLTRQLTHITRVKSRSQMTDLTSDLTFGTLVRKTCLIHCTRGNDLPIQTALPTLAERGCPFVGSCSDLFVLNLTWMARWRPCASDVSGFVLAGMALH